MENNIPKITTKQTEHLRSLYPSLSHLEAGNIAEWLQERKEQLFEIARTAENEADMTRVLGLVASGIGAVCYAVNPLAVVGGLIGGAAWLWFVVEHSNRTKEIAPIPFVRGNFIDAIARAGDYDIRSDYQADHLANTVKFLERHEAEEYAFLLTQFENISQYLNQVEAGKRFYAYRWMFGWFGKLKGRQLPTIESMNEHLQHVALDSRVNQQEVTALAEQARSDVAQIHLSPTIDIKQFQSPTVDIRQLQSPTQKQSLEVDLEQETVGVQPVDHKQPLAFDPAPKIETTKSVDHRQPPAFDPAPKIETTKPVDQRQPPAFDPAPRIGTTKPMDNKQRSSFDLTLETMIEKPIDERASFLIKALTESGFLIEDMMSSQVVAIAGTQRGGKGTLAAILATLSKALDPSLNTQYFTARVDVYPFACNLTSALKYPQKDADGADGLVARELLKFLKGLDCCQPYSHQNLLLVIDEAMRLLSLLEESDRTWAIQYLLSRFAKCGGTLIIVLHGSNLTSVVGKATSGLADTFKASINFIGCVAKSVSAGGLRKINVASGEYFKANPGNFGEPVIGGNLGMIPEWLKTEKHPGNGQPDPARTLLKFFPELVQQHQEALMPRGEKIADEVAITKLESIFSQAAQETELVEIESHVEVEETDLNQIIAIVSATTNPPTSFAAIRNSRYWGEEKPRVRYLRDAIALLIESKQLCGDEKEGFRIFEHYSSD